jgi:hypothetical protein
VIGFLSGSSDDLLDITLMVLSRCVGVIVSSREIDDASFDGVGDISSMALTKRSIALNASSH